MLRSLPQELGETAPLAILLGAATGAGLVHLLSGTVGQSSSESLEVLALGSLQVFAPVGVNLVWILRSAPLRVERAARRHLKHRAAAACPVPDWRLREFQLTSAVLVALLLMPWFLGALLLGGLLATPRAGLGLGSELRELVGLITPADLAQGVLRTAVFAAAAQAVCLHKGSQVRRSTAELPRLIADAVPECLLVVTALEAIWIMVAPLHGTYA